MRPRTGRCPALGVDFVMIRTYYSVWERESPAQFHIERSDRPRPFPAPLSPEQMADRLARVSEWIQKALVYWKNFMDLRYLASDPNEIRPPESVKGASASIAYGGGSFQLGPDQALIAETEIPKDATYWSYPWYTYPWFEAPDYANRQTHLTGDRMHVNADGKVRMAFAHRDPGIPNWIDTEGRTRGAIAYRYVGAKSSPAPRSQVVSFEAIGEFLPADTRTVSAAERRASIATRREHVARRFRR